MTVLDSMARNAVPFAKLGDPKAVREGSERTVLMPNGQKVMMTSLNGEWIVTSDEALRFASATALDPSVMAVGQAAVVNGSLMIKHEHGLTGVPSKFAATPRKTIRPFGKTDTSAAVLGWTGHLTILSKVPFYALRFNFVNAGTAAMTGLKAAFALPDTNPTPCVTTASWTNITVGGATAFGIAAASNAEQPLIAQSDIIPCTCVKRTDGEGYLIMVRLYIPAAGNTVGPRTSGTSDLSAPNTLDLLGFQAGYWNGGDGVTNPASFARSSAALGLPAFVEVYSSDVTTPVLLVVGDSIVCGQGGGDAGAPTAHQYGAYKRYANYRGWIAMCGGISGQKSPDFIQQGLDKYVAQVSPKFAIAPPWSINDDDALVAGVEKRVLYNMVRWLESCHVNGAIPVFLTPAPRNGITLAQETVRRTVVQAIKDFCASNDVLCIDRDSVWTNYDSATGGYKAGLFADDLHPNAAGYAAELELWKQVLGTKE